jgi:hypothetical protein
MYNIAVAIVLFITQAAELIFAGLGTIDSFLSNIMTAMGADPVQQMVILCVLALILAVLSLRYVPGILGWITFTMLALMVVYWVVPPMHSFGTPVTAAISEAI